MASLPLDSGTATVMMAYSVGFSIDLDEAERKISANKERARIRTRRRSPRYFEFTPIPLRISQNEPSIEIGRWSTHEMVESVVYDFGAISITFQISVKGTLDDCVELSELLYEDDELLARSRVIAQEMLHQMGEAVKKPELSKFDESYVIFQSKQSPRQIKEKQSEILPTIAQILHAERDPLSNEEIQDTANCQISYTQNDIAWVDWNGAVIFDDQAADVKAVLEFANVQLMEMRLLDEKLDKALEDSYDILNQESWKKWWKPSLFRGDLGRVGHMEVDGAILFEGVTNALKLIGDQYLARVYRLASDRLHLPQWDANIRRKINTLENIYEKISDTQDTLRMELLEWIIIILIAVSMFV